MSFVLQRPKTLFHFLQMVDSDPNYGWVPDPADERDEEYDFTTTAANTNYSADVDEIDNTKYFKPISMQFDLPACTANAGADLLEAVTIKDRVDYLLAHSGVRYTDAGEAAKQAQGEVVDFSREFLWWNGRNMMDPPQHKNIKSGCYNRLIMDVASRFGVCRESLWPYDQARLPPNGDPRPIVRPSLSAYRDARGHMTKSYHALTGHGDARLEQVVKALQATPGVLFGTALGPMFGATCADVVYRPTTRKGRHAMVIVGYSKRRQAFLVRNSWGPDFGVKGYFWMHEGYVAWSGTRSLWVCTKGVMS